MFSSDIGLYQRDQCASPMSPPQRSLFRAARQQLAQQLMQTTASASKRWRIHDEGDVEMAPHSPTYISYHQPSPQFDFGSAAKMAEAAVNHTPVRKSLRKKKVR